MDSYKQGLKVLPYTGSRYKIVDENFELIDGFNNKILKEVDGGYVLEHPVFKRLSKDELWMLAYKPLRIDQYDFTKAWVDGKFEIIKHSDRPLARLNGFWKFKIECSYYPSYYYIPGFSSYVMNEDGEIISTITGNTLTTYIANNGYPSLRMVRDDGASVINLLHVLKAWTFKDWDQNILNLQVDHLDGNKLNHELTNLEIVTQHDNILRAKASNFYGKGSLNDEGKFLYYKDMFTGKEGVLNSLRKLSEEINISVSTIKFHLAKVFDDRLLKSQYIVAIVSLDHRGEVIDKDRILSKKYVTREGSQPKQVLAKNTLTGEVTQHRSVVEFIEWSGLSRKQVYENLHKGKQKVYGFVVFKYHDNQDEWIA